MRTVRLIAGVAVVLVLIAFAALVSPVYLRNGKFHHSLERIARRSDNDAVLRAAVIDEAARLDLPVQPGDVSVLRSPDHLRIDVRYKIPVDFSVYSVYLHFHPSAGN